MIAVRRCGEGRAKVRGRPCESTGYRELYLISLYKRVKGKVFVPLWNKEKAFSGVKSLYPFVFFLRGTAIYLTNKERFFSRKEQKKAVFLTLQTSLKQRLKKKEQLLNQKTSLESEKIKNLFSLKCSFPTVSGDFYLVDLQPIIISCFNIFNQKKTNNLFGCHQYCLQLKVLVQDYLQLGFWEKGIQTIHSTKQNANHVLNLLLTNLAVKCFTLKKSENLVIKRFYIYKTNCMKCRLFKEKLKKKTNFLKRIRNCLCFFKGNDVFFCFSPLQKPLRQLLREPLLFF